MTQWQQPREVVPRKWMSKLDILANEILPEPPPGIWWSMGINAYTGGLPMDVPRETGTVARVVPS